MSIEFIRNGIYHPQRIEKIEHPDMLSIDIPKAINYRDNNGFGVNRSKNTLSGTLETMKRFYKIFGEAIEDAENIKLNPREYRVQPE